MTTAGTASVTQRLEHLERQNRWPKLAGVAVLTLARGARRHGPGIAAKGYKSGELHRC